MTATLTAADLRQFGLAGGLPRTRPVYRHLVRALERAITNGTVTPGRDMVRVDGWINDLQDAEKPGNTLPQFIIMALGENLWRRFLPKYLEALGAPVVAIGAYGSTEDLLDGLYQYPGGWVGDRHGRRRALLLFVSLAAAGYLVVASATTM